MEYFTNTIILKIIKNRTRLIADATFLRNLPKLFHEYYIHPLKPKQNLD